MEEQVRKGQYNVKVENLTEALSCLGVAGPKSRDVLSRLTTQDLSTSAFPFLAAKTIVIGDMTVLALRISYTGSY